MAVKSSHFDDHFKSVVRFIEDENAVATYRSLCRRLDIDVQAARKLLDHYVSSRQRQHYEGALSVAYCMTGEKTIDEITETIIAVVVEDNVDEWGKDYQNIQKQIYSIQAMDLENSDPLYMADHPMDGEAVKSVRESSMISCKYVRTRGPGERYAFTPVLEVGPFTAKTLVKIETEQKKIVQSMGETFHALKVKGSQPTEPPATKPKEGVIAAWVKSGGLDPKQPQSHPLKDTMQAKIKTAAVPIEKTTVKSESRDTDDEDDAFAPKKSRKQATKIMDSDDDEDEDVPMHVQDELNDHVDEVGSSQMSELTTDRTMTFEDNVERSPSPDEPRILRRRMAKSTNDTPKPVAKKEVPKSMGELTQVSDDEPELQNDEEVQKPSRSRKRVRPDESNSGGRDKKSSKKTANFYGSDLENDDSNVDDEENAVSEIAEPIRQYLKAEPVSEKKQKQIMKSYYDEEGYLVSEKVWVDEEVAKKAEEKTESQKAEKTALESAKSEKPVPVEKLPAKKKDMPATKSKQPSITSFFAKK